MKIVVFNIHYLENVSLMTILSNRIYNSQLDDSEFQNRIERILLDVYLPSVTISRSGTTL